MYRREGIGKKDFRNRQAIRLPRGWRRAGTSLLEVIATVALLGILVSLCLKMFVMDSRLTALNALHLNRLENLRAVQHRFRESVRESQGVVEGVLDYRTSEDQLVLRLADMEGIPRYTVWGAFAEADHLSMLQVALETPPQVERLETLNFPVEGVGFTQDPSTGLVTLRFSLKHDAGERVSTSVPVHEIRAVPRGQGGVS